MKIDTNIKFLATAVTVILTGELGRNMLQALREYYFGVRVLRRDWVPIQVAQIIQYTNINTDSRVCMSSRKKTQVVHNERTFAPMVSFKFTLNCRNN